MIRQIAVPPLDRLEPHLPRLGGSDPGTAAAVAAIVTDVIARGDVAVRAYTLKFDAVDLAPGQWELPQSEWGNALDRLDLELRDALETAVGRVRDYHQRQRDLADQLLRRYH